MQVCIFAEDGIGGDGIIFVFMTYAAKQYAAVSQ